MHTSARITTVQLGMVCAELKGRRIVHYPTLNLLDPLGVCGVQHS